jgi:type I restriction enzyme S subunit
LALGHTPRRAETAYWDGGTVPWASIADLNNSLVNTTRERITERAFQDVFHGRIVPAGTLLLSFKLTIGKVGILGFDATHNEAIVNITPHPDVASRDFLFFLLQALDYDHMLDAYVKGKTLNKEKLLALPLTLPPLPEQRAIASVLSAVRRAIEATEAVIGTAEGLKRSLVQYLLKYGPLPTDQASREVLSEGTCGPRPSGWTEVPLRHAIVKTPLIDPRRTPDRLFKYVDVSSVSSATLQIVSTTERNGRDAPSRARKAIKAGDVIIATIRPGLRRIAMVPDELDGELCSTAFCVIRAKDDLATPVFLFHSVSEDGFVRRLSEHQRGSSYPAVTDGDVLGMPIRLPSLEDQHLIGSLLQAIDRKISAEWTRRHALTTLFSACLGELVTGERRVAEAND